MSSTETRPRLNFEDWRRKADAICNAAHGLSLDDLADCPYYDWYEEGLSPAGAVKRAVRNEMSGDYE